MLLQWGENPNKAFPDDAIAYAHSLAGSSATVGFGSLSELARATEHALAHVQHASQPEVAWLNTFQASGSEIRKLLHQVAAGFVKPANEIVLHDLQAIAHLEIDTALHPPYEAADAPISDLQDLELDEPSDSSLAALEPAPELPSAAHAADHVAEVVDVIDPDLFLIFEEEAQELLPKLGSALREWSSDPNYLPPRGEVLRHLQLVPGDLFMLLATLIWSLYTWLLTKAPGPQEFKSDWAQFLFAQVLFGVLWSGLFTATEASLGAFHLVLGWPLITALVFITIGPAILAYRFWGAGVRRSSPAVGGFFANLIPLFTAILSVLVLGQAPQLYHAGAFVLIVGGILVASRR